MHFVPEKFDLQLHIPLESHDLEEDPELLQLQSEKRFVETISSVYNHTKFSLLLCLLTFLI